MNKKSKKALNFIAKVSEIVAVKSCSATSGFDTYQPKIPAEVRKIVKK